MFIVMTQIGNDWVSVQGGRLHYTLAAAQRSGESLTESSRRPHRVFELVPRVQYNCVTSVTKDVLS